MEQKRTVYDNLSLTIICMLPIKANVLNHHGLPGCRYTLLRSSYPLVFQVCLGPMQALPGSTGIDVTMRVRIVLVAFSVLFLIEQEKAVIRCADRNNNR